MEDRIVIRRARRTDYPAVAALLKKVTGENLPEEKRFLRFYRKITKDLGCDFYMAELAGQVVGMVSVGYRRVLSRTGLSATVDEVVIKRGRESEEVGQRLLAFALERARRKGCCGIEICVDAHREKELRKLLVGTGFSQDGELWRLSFRGNG